MAGYLAPATIGGRAYLAPLNAPTVTPPQPIPSGTPILAVYAPMRATGINLYSKLL